MTYRVQVLVLSLGIAALPLHAQQATPQQVQQLQAQLAAQQRQFEAQRAQLQSQLADMAKALTAEKAAQNKAFQNALAAQVQAEQSLQDQKLRRALQDADAARYAAALAQLKQLQAEHSGPNDSDLYWQAFMQSKLGQDRQAQESLSQMQKLYPQSAWGSDARALSLQLQQRNGHTALMLVGPDSNLKRDPNDDLKLLAINGLMQTDPQHAVPMLTEVVQGHSSTAVKSRALFVLAQSGTAAGLNELLKVAQGNGDPALAAQAVRYIGFYNDFKSTPVLVQLAQTAATAEVRDQAVRSLAETGSTSALAALPSLYAGVANRDRSLVVIQALFEHGQAEQLVELARNEKDPNLKRAIVSDLARMKAKPATDYLLELLKND